MLDVMLIEDPSLNFKSFLPSIAIEHNSINSMEYLIKNKNIDVNQEYHFNDNKNLLNVAVENNKVDMIKLLVENGADIFR